MKKVLSIVACLVLLAAAPREAGAYSVLAHEANVDTLWDSGIRPLLVRRFPRSTRDDLLHAKAYAYGGAVIQDLGYYPFGSHFFSNLLHYVRTGDFVETMIRDAQDLNEYAFALGALSHYAADNAGHPEAVNRAVALMFPKLRAKYGNAVTYVESPSSHILVEFSFDVVQVAGGKYVSETYHDLIGFQVAKPVIERAFRETYGLEMKDVFSDEDLAIGSYRHAISETIPEITRIAWRDKQDAIVKAEPGRAREKFEFSMSRQRYEQDYGSTYTKPGVLARVLVFLYKILPKVGPLKGMKFTVPTPEAEALFVQSLKDTRGRYGESLTALASGRLDLPNTDFDTGKPSAHGEYALADDTYAELLGRLAKRDFKGVPDALRKNITAFYGSTTTKPASRRERKRAERIQKQLSGLGGRG